MEKHMSQSRCSTPMPTQRRITHNGFTLIELLVVISIISILIAILLPSLAKARQSSRNVKCLASLKQIGMIMHTYCNDYDDYYPYSNFNWIELTWTYAYPGKVRASAVPNTLNMYPRTIYSCAELEFRDDAGVTFQRSYAFNMRMVDNSSITPNRSIEILKPAACSLNVDYRGSSTLANPYDVSLRHLDAFNNSYADGHAGSLKWKSTYSDVTNTLWSGK